MNIKSMLMRLASALNCPDLIEELILHPGTQVNPTTEGREQNLQFVVGYNSSPYSHAALDLTLWIAHQTRLVRRCAVVVHVVYVLEPQDLASKAHFSASRYLASPQDIHLDGWGRQISGGTGAPTDRLDQQTTDTICAVLPALEDPAEQFSHADRVLWQARCLANEWRGSLQTHLRFGQLATELRTVVEAESAALLIVGCHQASHHLISGLGQDLPCPILGIPTGELDLGS